MASKVMSLVQQSSGAFKLKVAQTKSSLKGLFLDGGNSALVIGFSRDQF